MSFSAEFITRHLLFNEIMRLLNKKTDKETYKTNQYLLVLAG